MEGTEEIVIDVNHVYKDFVLPHEKNDTVKSVFTSIYKKRSKKVEVQNALKDVSLQIKKGEFFGIVGRNGSGKSTMLKMLANIYQPTKGSIKTYGRLVPFIELGVGFNPELTGKENVYLNGAMMGFTQDQTDSMYKDIVEFAELEDFMGQKLKNYSSGMQVRLAFSVAVRSEADILIVDEVLAVGDADFQRKCYDYFRKLKNDKTTVVFVSHSMDAIREYCDRVALIDNSVCKFIGPPEKVADEYLKLFNKASKIESAQQTNLPENRWGTGEIKLGSIKLINQKGKLTFQATVNAKESVDDDLVLGLRIKKAEAVICGLSTETSKNSLGDTKTNAKRYFRVDKGKTTNISFTMDNIFSDGNYSIDATIRNRNGVVIYDNWDNSYSFKINNKGARFEINPVYKVSIKES